MNTRIKDITLLKFIGKGSFGTVYLSKKDGKPGFFATKQIERSMADKPGYYKYFENELRLLKDLHHPNIVHLEDVKKDDKYYYIVMEFVNGGSLTDCLKKYQSRYGKAFPEEIVQYLMRQIVEAIKFIHQRNIIHRDLKLDNIMVSFDNENDKNSLNMMKAKVKIIDFGFATKLTPEKNNLAQTALGSPINMDPLILNVMAKKGKDLKQLGYDDKADIWSLGTICYELLIGKTVFNAETMNDLVQQVESGSYHVPTSLSREMVSFLNSMLQYDGSKRLSAEELSNHPFLTKSVRNFTKINTRQVRKKIDNQGLNINIKRNQTIWSIFNEEDEKKLIDINDRNNDAPLRPIPEMKMPQDNINRKHYTEKNIPHIKKITINVNKNYGKSNSNNYPFAGPTHSIYGHNMSPNQNNYMPQYPNFNPVPNMSPFPQNQGYGSGMNMFNPMMPYPTFAPSPNTFNRNIFQMNSQGYTSNYMGSRPQENMYIYQKSMNNNEVVDLCSIQ